MPDWRFDTARLHVRPVEAQDAQALHWIRGQMPFDPLSRDLSGTRAMIHEMLGRTDISAPGWQQFVLVVKDGGAIAGDIGVRFENPGPRQAEIGFALHPDWRGMGLATEAVGAVADRLFEGGLHRLEALTDARNLPTQRLLLKLRFRQEAHYVQSWPEGDDWLDELGYARLSTD
ncbi:GNAT family N-acetyltransferase [Glacieibacterium sp.]|uniref:GNAT family N-acetyltransferase n=1 Tax=Glacieibacterium sp. TaxID=2860237 RepID=UPI003B00A4C2